MDFLTLQIDDSTWLEFCRCFGIADAGHGTYSAAYSGGRLAVSLTRPGGPCRQLCLSDYTLDWMVVRGFAIEGGGQRHDNVDCLPLTVLTPSLTFGEITCAFCAQMETEAVQLDLEFPDADYDSYTMRRMSLHFVNNKIT
jgi:hypothetical protein